MPRLTYRPGLIVVFSLLCVILTIILLRELNLAQNNSTSDNSVWVINSSSKFDTEPLDEDLQSVHDLFSIGQHFIVGLENFKTLSILVEHGAIGGIFLGDDYIKGKSIDQLKHEINSLQAIQAINKLPPLIIATDQEGGLVERLSPPLPNRSQLSDLVDHTQCSELPNSCFTLEERLNVEQYGIDQGSDLSSLGVTLNFAPVVDIYQGIRVPIDAGTRLSQRSLSPHPWLVRDISTHYIVGLNQSRVIATLKHFPGLGSATRDTHISDATLIKSLPELETFDLLPFKSQFSQKTNAIMLSHAHLNDIDPEYPTSISHKVVADYLRGDMRYDGLLIADDFNMYPIQNSQLSPGDAAVMALNSGVDLILFTGQLDQFLSILETTLSASSQNSLSQGMLSNSHVRLNQARLWTQNYRSN